MLRIGIDLDGVLVNFMAGYCQAVDPTYVFDHSKVDKWKWGAKEFGKLRDGQFWKTTAKNPEFWLQLPPYSQYDLHLTKLLTERHMVYFVTSKPDGVEKGTLQWLNHHMKGHEGQMVVSNDKGHIAKGLKLDVLLDDKIENLDDVSAMTQGQTKCLLLNQPWNQRENPHMRVYSVEEAYKVIEQSCPSKILK